MLGKYRIIKQNVSFWEIVMASWVGYDKVVGCKAHFTQILTETEQGMMQDEQEYVSFPTAVNRSFAFSMIGI